MTTTLDVPVLDAHVHLWDPRTTPRIVSPAVKLLGGSERALRTLVPRLFPPADLAFVGRTDYVLASFLPGHLRRDHEGTDVRGFVHVEASWNVRDPMRYADETRWLEALCGPDLRAIVGNANLAHPRLDALLQAHRAASPRFVGVRDKLAYSSAKGVARWAKSGDRMRDPAWRHGYARLAERGLTFDAWMYAPQLRDFEQLVREVPTRVVLDHLGTPIGLGGPDGARVAAAWHEDLARLAEHRHVHAKISGLTMPVVGFDFHTRATPPSTSELVDALGPHVEHALRVFGVERCLFASNFPMDKVSVPWATLFEAFAQLTARFTVDERRALFHDNALRFYGV